MTMYTTWKQQQRRFVNIEQAGKFEEIARRSNVGQMVGDSDKTPTTNKHTR